MAPSVSAETLEIQMNVVRALNDLECRLTRFSVLMTLLWCTQIGIIFLLTLVGLGVLLTKCAVDQTLKGAASTNAQVSSSTPVVRKVENTLLHILEISCPVGVLVVSSPGVPTPEAPFTSFSRYGTYPGVTVGGNRVWSAEEPEVILSGYWFLSEDLCNGFIHISRITAEKLQQGREGSSELGHQIPICHRSHQLMMSKSIVPVPRILSIVPMGSSPTEPKLRRIQRKVPGGSMRLFLMMTGPWVRSTLKTSDDGTFGKCRNLRNTDERG